MTAPKISAIDALGRGIANLRANRELVLVQVASGLLLAASIVVPLLFFFVRIGVPLKALSGNDPEAVARALAEVRPDLGEIASLLGLGFLVMLVVATLVFVLYCWFQAGTLAVLLAGEAQAPAGPRMPVAVFRTFSWSGFVGWASAYAMRIFWVINLFLVFFTLLLLALALPFLFAAGLSSGEWNPAGCLLGCGLALPVGFLLLVLTVALTVAEICAVEEGASVLGASRRGFKITGNRLGGLLLLYLLAICASIAVSMIFGISGLVLKLALARFELLHLIVSGGLGLVEFFINVAVTLVMTAAVVALVRPEMRPASALAPRA